MIVQMVWPRCGYRNGDWSDKPIDSFWVECTPAEVEEMIAPRLSPQQQQELNDLRAQYAHSNPNTFVLIALDLSSIQPMEPHYPYGNLWNAYSPFRPVPPQEVHDLEQLRGLDFVALIVGPQSPGDPPFTRRMRFHQSWYRANELGVLYGTGPTASSARLYGNMLTPEAAEVGVNFLSPAIFAVAEMRLARKDGLIDRFRLLHNMLASQTMCFNLFAPLTRDLDVTTQLVRALLPNEVGRVTRVEIEYAPKPADEYLGDNTAFDAFIEYTRPEGEIAFLGIETKLSEPFSRQAYDSPRYRALTEHPRSPWPQEAWLAVANIRHNQLWRDHLLVEAMLKHPGSKYAAGRLVLVRHPQDVTCAQTVADYRKLLRPVDDTFMDLPLDRLIAAWRSTLPSNDTERLAWLSALDERYLRLEDSEADWRRKEGKTRA